MSQVLTSGPAGPAADKTSPIKRGCDAVGGVVGGVAKQMGAINSATNAAATANPAATTDLAGTADLAAAQPAQPAPPTLYGYVVVYRDGRDQVVFDGPLGDVLAGHQPVFTYEKYEEVRVALTQRDGMNSDWKRDVVVGWVLGRGSFFVGMPMDHGLPLGDYTSPSPLGQTTGFEQDLFAEVLSDLAKMDITSSERCAALATYFRMLKEACKHVPLSIMPKTFNVLAAVPALDVGFDEATQEFLVDLVRDMLGHLLVSVSAGNQAWFLEDFQVQLLPRPFKRACMKHKEYRFRLELVGAVRMAFGA